MSRISELNEGRSWREALLVYSRPRVIAMAFLGFSAGLPFLLVFSTLSAWLRDEGLSRSAIGFFAWVGLTYSIKFAWAPVIDRLAVPGITTTLGRRRGWMLIGQAGIALGLLLMALIGPGADALTLFALAALMVAFASATQDIAIDAWRIEAEAEDVQGAMSATYILGYRVALLAAGAGALFLAEALNWPLAYLCMAGLMLVGMFTVLAVAEPEHRSLSLSRGPAMRRLAAWFAQAVVNPFVDFVVRNGRFAIVVLVFIAVYRLSDIAMGIMANPFYLDMGYTKSEIASVAKVFGFFMAIAGSALGGLAVMRFGVVRSLMAGAVAVAATNLLFALLATLNPTVEGLAVVISADNLSGGFAGAAFIAYLSSLTNRAYTATQYALFSSLMTLPGKFISGFSGIVVDGYGYAIFFVVAALLGLPAICLVWMLMRRATQGAQP